MSAFDRSHGDTSNGSPSNSGASSRRREPGENKPWLPTRYRSSQYYHRYHRYEHGHSQSVSSGQPSAGYEDYNSQLHNSRRPEPSRSSSSGGINEHTVNGFDRRPYSRESNLSGLRDGLRHRSANSAGDLIGRPSSATNHGGDLISPRSSSTNGNTSFSSRGVNRDYWNGNGSNYTRSGYGRGRHYDESRYKWNSARNSSSPSSYYHSVSPHDSVSTDLRQEFNGNTRTNDGVVDKSKEITHEKRKEDEQNDNFEGEDLDDDAYSPKINPSEVSESSNNQLIKATSKNTEHNDAIETDEAGSSPVIKREIKDDGSAIVKTVPTNIIASSSKADIMSDTKSKSTESNEPILENSSDLEWSEDEFSAPTGCIFPMQKVPYRLWSIKSISKKRRRLKMIYFSSGHIDNLTQYNFYGDVIMSFKKSKGVQLFDILSKLHAALKEKQSRLAEEYVSRDHIWRDRCSIMETHCKEIDDLENTIRKERENKKDKKKKKKEEQQRKAREQALKEEEERKQKARRARHHGDSVRTEAEFLDILATFEKEREKDPLVKAQYGAAIIPDQTMDPVQKMGLDKYMDSNNRVQDKEKWALRIETDPVDTFTEAEQHAFEKAFAMYPKKFGRISRYMGGLRSPEECVLHYYVTKRKVDYKEIVSSRNKRGKKKSKKKDKGRRHSRESRSRHELRTPKTPDSSMADSSFDTPGFSSEKKKSTGAMLRSHNFRRYPVPATSPESPQTSSTQTPSTPRDTRDSSENRRSSLVTQKADDEDVALEDDSKREAKSETDEVDDAETEPDSEAETEPDSDALYASSRFGTDGASSFKAGEDTQGGFRMPGESHLSLNQRSSDVMHSSSEITESSQPSNETVHSVVASLAAGAAAKMGHFTSTDSKRVRRGRKRTRDVPIESAKDKRREHGHRLKNKVTSYWSVQESAEFPVLLTEFGTDWDSIAKSLGSKTAPMVRNFYQRGLAINPGWRNLAAGADSRKPSEVINEHSVPSERAEFQQVSRQISPQQTAPSQDHHEQYIAREENSNEYNQQSRPALQQPYNISSSGRGGVHSSGTAGLQQLQQSRPVPATSASVPILTRKPTIMSLLNDDNSLSTQEPPIFGSTSSPVAPNVGLPPIRPSISNMINPAYDTRPVYSNPRYELQPGISTPSELKREPPTFGEVQRSAALQQNQQAAPQNVSNRTAKRGLSALEALAQVAFERK